MEDLFIELIQTAIGDRECLSHTPSVEEWNELYSMSKKQSVAAFVFNVLDRLSNAGQKPSMSILYEWIGLSETVKMQNTLMNQEATRLTKLFEQEEHKNCDTERTSQCKIVSLPLVPTAWRYRHLGRWRSD